jgi:hypothetical protein
MKGLFNSIRSLFSDEHGVVSMKRLCGLLCTITLCATLYQNSFTEEHIAPSTAIVDAVAMLAFGCLGLSSVDKIWGKKPNNTDDTPPPPSAE